MIFVYIWKFNIKKLKREGKSGGERGREGGWEEGASDRHLSSKLVILDSFSSHFSCQLQYRAEDCQGFKSVLPCTGKKLRGFFF